jgi:hypothetical protein
MEWYGHVDANRDVIIIVFPESFSLAKHPEALNV